VRIWAYVILYLQKLLFIVLPSVICKDFGRSGRRRNSVAEWWSGRLQRR